MLNILDVRNALEHQTASKFYNIFSHEIILRVLNALGDLDDALLSSDLSGITTINLDAWKSRHSALYGLVKGALDSFSAGEGGSVDFEYQACDPFGYGDGSHCVLEVDATPANSKWYWAKYDTQPANGLTLDKFARDRPTTPVLMTTEVTADSVQIDRKSVV